MAVTLHFPLPPLSSLHLNHCYKRELCRGVWLLHVMDWDEEVQSRFKHRKVE